jgi:UDP-galactopyranose mutase
MHIFTNRDSTGQMTVKTHIKKPIAIVGAGFSGAVIARTLADAGFKVVLFDSRSHVAGNCYTERHNESGIMVHEYGPHIFHTNLIGIWDYIQQYGEFYPYQHTVKAIAKNTVYSFPVNLMTFNQVFQTCLNPKAAIELLNKIKSDIQNPANFEEAALSMVGEQIYRLFFAGYTEKQWGMSPTHIPASILKRLPVRFSYDDNYYNHIYQGIPKDGYTSIVERMITHKNIELHLNHHFQRSGSNTFSHVFYSGKIDEWFNFELGHLPYRTLFFERLIAKDDFQGCAVINYCDKAVPYTRITEFNHFTPQEAHAERVCFLEYSKQAGPQDIPFYPIHQADKNDLLTAYQARAMTEENVSFVGRLGTYRYLDMDVAIKEAISAGQEFIRLHKDNKHIPQFFHELGRNTV